MLAGTARRAQGRAASARRERTLAREHRSGIHRHSGSLARRRVPEELDTAAID
jgi:hypothetical protein